MKIIDIAYLKENNLIIFECISGSRLYGTDLPTSDTDIKGVFILPQEDFYGLNPVEQVQNESNDIVYYELKRFIELLYRNNPNLLEILNVPQECVIFKHPLFERISAEFFISKLCCETFAGYAITQIKRAKGLNKKISKPIPLERKTILDFCYVTKAHSTIPLRDWLSENSYQQQYCGLVNIPHIPFLYGIYYDNKAHETQGRERLGYNGIVKDETNTMVILSSIPMEEIPVGYMCFNKDSYSVYCKEYKQYWDWVENRNEERYQNTLTHGKNYDAKNMMHVFRLLEMAEEIAITNQIYPRRPNRDELLKIRRGEYEYNDLLTKAEEKIEIIIGLFAKSTLPSSPNIETVENLVVTIRKLFYSD